MNIIVTDIQNNYFFKIFVLQTLNQRHPIHVHHLLVVQTAFVKY